MTNIYLSYYVKTKVFRKRIEYAPKFQISDINKNNQSNSYYRIFSINRILDHNYGDKLKFVNCTLFNRIQHQTVLYTHFFDAEQVELILMRPTVTSSSVRISEFQF